MKKLLILVLAITIMILFSSKIFADEITPFPAGRTAASTNDPHQEASVQAAVMVTPGALRPEDTPAGSDCPMCDPGNEEGYNPAGTTSAPGTVQKRR